MENSKIWVGKGLGIQSRYQVEVRAVPRALPVSKELQEELKGLGTKTVSRMRREAVECPVKVRHVVFGVLRV